MSLFKTPAKNGKDKKDAEKNFEENTEDDIETETERKQKEERLLIDAKRARQYLGGRITYNIKKLKHELKRRGKANPEKVTEFLGKLVEHQENLHGPQRYIEEHYVGKRDLNYYIQTGMQYVTAIEDVKEAVANFLYKKVQKQMEMDRDGKDRLYFLHNSKEEPWNSVMAFFQDKDGTTSFRSLGPMEQTARRLQYFPTSSTSPIPRAYTKQFTPLKPREFNPDDLTSLSEIQTTDHKMLGSTVTKSLKTKKSKRKLKKEHKQHKKNTSYILDDSENSDEESSTFSSNDSSSNSNTELSEHHSDPSDDPSSSDSESDKRKKGKKKFGQNKNSHGGNKGNLPPLEIPYFDGSNVKDYIAWWTAFNNMVHKTELPMSYKIQYLLMYLIGPARAILEGTPRKGRFYIKALTEIQERYGRRKVILDHIVTGFDNIKPAKSYEEFEDLYNETAGTVAALKSLDLEVDAMSDVLIPLIKKKLHPRLQRDWNKFSLGKEKLKIEITITDFVDFLKDEILVSDPYNFAKQIKMKKQIQHEDTKRKNKKKHDDYKGLKSSITNQRPSTNNIKPEIRHCFACGEEKHDIKNCPAAKNMAARMIIILAKHHNICFRCLNSNHNNKDCKEKGCPKCDGNHHEILHRDNTKTYKTGIDSESCEEEIEENQSSEQSEEDEDEGNWNCFLTSQKGNSSKTILQTMTIQLETDSGNKRQTRALLDTGSEKTFLKRNLGEELGLNGPQKTFNIHGIGDRQKKEKCREVQFNIILGNKKLKINAIEMKNICSDTLQITNIKKSWKHLQGLNLNKVENQNNEIGLIIGLDIYDHVVTGNKILGKPGQPNALETKNGWILYGNIDEKKTFSEINSTKAMFCRTMNSQTETQNDLDILWKSETIAKPLNELMTVDEEQAENHFIKTTTFNEEEKRYQIRLPFRHPNQNCPNNRQPVYHRLTSLERQLDKNTAAKEQFHAAIDEYIQQGFVEKVTTEMQESCITGKEWYIPIQVVIDNDRVSTKCRLVFDGGTTYQSFNLNESLLPGVKLQPDIAKMLLMFRQGKYTLTADISKMFHSISVHPEDRNFLRFFYRKHPKQPPEIYRFKRIIFGLTCSPYQSIRTLKLHCQKHINEFPLAANEILNNMYVDDLITSCDDEQQLINLQQEVLALGTKGNFKFTKFTSNNKNILNNIPENQRNPQADFLINEITDKFKTLGIRFNTKNDDFVFNIKQLTDKWTTEKITKRIILSQVSQIFDPMGFVTLLITHLKILLQDIWITGTDWDDLVTEEIKTKWLSILEDLKNSTDIRIPRHIGGGHSIKSYTLHGFSDASERAYAAVVYARCLTSDGQIHTTLLMSKSKLAPIKTITIPRLELMGMLLLANLISYLKESFGITQQCYCYTDSMICLYWVQQFPNKFKTFVATRIAKIQELVQPSYWSFVAGKGNPADLPSRGIMLGALTKNELWFNGPSWLKKPIKEHPHGIPEKTEHINENLKEIKTLTTKTTEDINLRNLINPKEFNDFRKLVNVTARVLQVVSKFKKNKEDFVSSLEKARLLWFRNIQNIHFNDEINQLKNKEYITKKSKLFPLNPLWDKESELILVKGRLSETPKRIVLPKNDWVIKLIILDIHESNLCIGPEQTMAEVRRSMWILGGKRTIRSVTHQCIKCTRQRAKQYEQKMGQIPSFRTTEGMPFDETGLDAFGPIPVKDSFGKAYGLIFTCAVTRAIHLETVKYLNTRELTDALTRFVARRGKPNTIHSDNAKGFIKLGATLNKNMENITAKQGIKWSYIPQLSPWHGGFWERLVQSVKQPLRVALRRNILPFHELETLLILIEGIVNQRPITYVSDDIEDLEVLRPSDVLLGKNKNTHHELKGGTFEKTYRKKTRLTSTFWQRWRKEYYSKLLPYKKWLNNKPNIKTNDLVLIYEKYASKSFWPIARVIKCYPGPDGKVRVVDLKTENGIKRRPIQLLYMLEESQEIPENTDTTTQNSSSPNMNKKEIPKQTNKKQITQKTKPTKTNLPETRPIEKRTRSGRLVKPNRTYQ